MRYLLTADIHLSLRKNRDFERERFLKYFRLLATQDVDTYVFTGDIFDHAKPNLDEINTFYLGLSFLPADKEKLISPGNHEALSKLDHTFNYLPKVGYTVVDNDIIHSDRNFDIYLVGHNHIQSIIDVELKDKQNILISHARCTIGMIKEEAPIKTWSKLFDYVFLGDIHAHHSPFDNVEYTSQPYNTKYTPEVDNGFIVLEVSGKSYTHTYVRTNLPNMIKLILPASKVLDTIKTLDDDNLYKIVVRGTLEELEDLVVTQRNIMLELEPVEEAEDLDELIDGLTSSEGKMNFTQTLLALVSEGYELTDEHIEYGKEILVEIASD